MAQVGSAEIIITADDSQARETIGGFAGFIQRASEIATGVIGGFAIWDFVSEGMKTAFKSTIEANAQMETYRNTLTTVLKSAEKAEQTLAWAEGFAAQTPFEIPDIIEATTRLAAYGLKAQDILGATGDMASIMGKPLMQAVEAVADAQTGELERLKEFGITKKMLIDQALKMGEGEIVNASGQITNMEGLNRALLQIMEDRYKGGMELQSKTFKGMISNVMDSLGTIGRELSKPMFEGLKNALSSLVPILASIAALVKGEFMVAGKILENAFGPEIAGKIQSFVTTSSSGFSRFNAVMSTVQGVLKATFAILTGNPISGIEILTKMGLSPQTVVLITMTINTIKTIISAGVMVIVKTWDFIRTGVVAVFQYLLPFIRPLLMNILNFVNGVIRQIQIFWNENGAMIVKGTQNFLKIVVAVFRVVMPAVLAVVQGVWFTIKNVIQGALDIILGLVTIFGAVFSGDWGKVWSGVGQVLKGAVRIILVLISQVLMGGILRALGALAKAAIGSVKGLARGIGDWFKNAAQSGTGAVSGMVRSLVNWFKNLRTQMVAQASQIAIGIQRYFSLMAQNGNIITRTFAKVVMGLFNSIRSSAVSVFNGVKNAIVNPIRTAKDTVTGILGTIKSAFAGLILKIPKPSLPNIDVSWKSFGVGDLKVKLPKFNISWHKFGGFFDNPTIAGLGEAGTEAAVPLVGRRMDPFAVGVARKLGEMFGTTGLQPSGAPADGTYVFQVQLNGRTIAQEVYPDITELQKEEEKRKRIGRGEVY